jgi:hypothetical protein
MMATLIKANWKTTTAGIAGIVGVLATALANWLNGNPVDVEAVTIAVTAIAVSIGLIASKDGDK